MKVKCKCGSVSEVTPKMAGKRARCKKCSTVFRIPEVSDSKPPATATSVQKPPPNFQQQGKTTDQSRQEREEALLSKYTSKPAKPDLEDRIAQRHRESIELNRVPNAVRYILIGVVCIAFSFGAWYLLDKLEDGGVAPAIAWALVYTKGKWWFPALLIIAGAWQIGIGVMSLIKVVDVDEEQQLPTKF